MTPEKHNRNVALAHLGYGLTNILLMTIGMMLFFRWSPFKDREDLIFSLVGFGVVSLLNLAYTLPSFVAAWALLKRKPSAKMAAIIAGAVAVMYFPFGPIVAGYTFWFLFNAPGKALYDNPHHVLSSAGKNGAEQSDTERAKLGMPDWR